MSEDTKKTAEPTAESQPYIELGNKGLNYLFSSDGQGIKLQGAQENANLSPIVLISGMAGTGKTTLALQIAFSNARGEGESADGFLVCFYSLEQNAESLNRTVDSFKFGARDQEKLVPLRAIDSSKPGLKQGAVNCCSLHPLPLTPGEAGSAFEQRLKQLTHALDVSRAVGKRRIFFLDSLNALSSESLTRANIQQLFHLFRSNNVSLIVTAEDSESSRFATETAQFQADVVIRMTKADKEYVQYYLEITKSRLCRQTFGRHVYKIRTPDGGEGTKGEYGIVVYPSIHAALTRQKRILADASKGLTSQQFDEQLRNTMGNQWAELVNRGKSKFAEGLRGVHKKSYDASLNIKPRPHASMKPPEDAPEKDFETRIFSYLSTLTDLSEMNEIWDTLLEALVYLHLELEALSICSGEETQVEGKNTTGSGDVGEPIVDSVLKSSEIRDRKPIAEVAMAEYCRSLIIARWMTSLAVLAQQLHRKLKIETKDLKSHGLQGRMFSEAELKTSVECDPVFQHEEIQCQIELRNQSDGHLVKLNGVMAELISGLSAAETSAKLAEVLEKVHAPRCKDAWDLVDFWAHMLDYAPMYWVTRDHEGVARLLFSNGAGLDGMLDSTKTAEVRTQVSDIAWIMQKCDVKPGACFSISGPPGTHRLALGMNLAAGKLSGWSRNILILSFGETAPIDFAGVAWFDRRWNFRDLKHNDAKNSAKNREKGSRTPHRKWWTTDYESDCRHPHPKRVRVLTFELGELTPEECFWAVREEIEQQSQRVKNNEAEAAPYSAVMICDTDAIANGFPLLYENKLFVPSLIELFYLNRLTSVWIGHKEEGHPTRDLERAVAARSDYRIYLSHSPTNSELPGIIRRTYDGLQGSPKDPSAHLLAAEQFRLEFEQFKQQLASAAKKDAKKEDLVSVVNEYLARVGEMAGHMRRADDIEQAVWLVIDNVTGKDYNRKPRWLWVKDKVLHCTSYQDYISHPR